ncbi:MAG TPA: YbaB/EbfC family nucleoid-associated protein [Verrucomicrobiales bacterium]|nr:YbaB/EbfC family nucleoid-associated protein [Verrucomicrobiales bacterium]
MNLSKMLKQAQQMQKKMQAAQEDLAQQSVEAAVGGGKVRVEANGAAEITAIHIDPSIVDPQDVEFLEGLLLEGVRQAQEKAKQLAAEEMGKVAGGLGLPPGMGF